MKRPEEIRSIQFVDSYFPVIDGVVQVVHNYAALMNEESYACVVCPRAVPPYDDAKLPYDVIRMPSFCPSKWQYAIALPGSMKGLDTLVQQVKPDILHVHSPFMQRTAALKLAKKYHLPLVSTFHTKYYDDAYLITGSKLFARRLISNLIHFYDRCDSVWACSEGTKETLRSYGYQGEITVVMNGTDYEKPADAEAVREKAAAHFSLRSEKKRLLFVGTQVWQKNIRLILDTMQLLCKTRSDIELIIVGGGTDENAIRQYAERLGLTEENVTFTGKITCHELLAGLFLSADLFFFPSVYDNAPIVLREASMLEVPSLLVEGSNAADVVTPGVNGFTAKESAPAMAETIQSIIDNESLLRQVGSEASRTIPLPWPTLIPEVRAHYAQIIENFHK